MSAEELEAARERKRQRKEDRSASSRSDGFTLPLENKRFEAFYQAIGFIPDEEWDSFLDALRRPLPACFHMDPDYAFTDELKAQLFAILKRLGDNNAAGASTVPPLEVLPWYFFIFLIMDSVLSVFVFVAGILKIADLSWEWTDEAFERKRH